MMKKRILAAIMAAAVFFSTAGSGINVNAAEETSDNSGTTYYVSTLRGKDTNDGKSERRPFYSLRKINELTLKPGDKILLECGSVFKNGYLHLFGQSGSEDAPIVIDQYGTGADPIIDTNGQGVWFQNYGKRLDNTWHTYQGYVSSSILLYDSEYIEINNLEIVNKAPKIETVYNATDTMNRTGVAVVAQDAGTIDHIHLKGLNIHDVIGNVYDKHMNNGGIYFTVYEPHDEDKTGISRYDDVLIEDCSVIKTNRWGIAVGYTTKWDVFADKAAIDDDDIAMYGSTNVVIRNNYVKDAGGDGITLMYCDRPLVEYNVSDGIGIQMNRTDYSEHGGYQCFSAAIWPWKCKDAVFQYNEAFDTKDINGENGDGQAWDADWGDGTLYQYNYSHGNGGGCLMVCLTEAYRTTFRYNISQGDLKGVFCVFGCPAAHIYNNVIYVEGDVPIHREGKSGAPATLENNIFYYAGDEPSTDNSWNQGNSKTYHNNLYYNYANTPTDPEGIVVAKDEQQIFVNAGSAPEDTTGYVYLHDDPTVKSVFDGYKLAENSPAIGKGKKVTDMHGMAASKFDFFGNDISNVETIDIGAYQHQETEGTLAPPAPQKVTVSKTEATSVTLQWPAADEVFGITGYKVLDGEKVLKEITNLAEVTDPETGMITVTLSGLNPRKEYSLSVVASDGGQLTSSSTAITFTTGKEAAYIEAENKLDKAVNDLEEKMQAGEANYTADEWNKMLAVYDKLLSIGSGSSKEDIEDLTGEIDTIIKDLQSKEEDNKPVKLTAPNVSDVKVVAEKDGVKIQVTLSKVANAASYKVYRTVGGSTTLAGTTTSTTFFDTELYGGKDVSYSAEAVSGNTSKFTDSAKGQSKSIKLANAPGKFKVKKKGSKAVISWKKVKNAKSYIVYRSTAKNGPYQKVATVKKKKNSYTDGKVKKKNTYYYKVVAKVGNSYTATTNAKKVKIK